MSESTLGACKHHPESEDCGCYCRLVGCGPDYCPVDVNPDSERSRQAVAMLEPRRLFRPRHMVMPLEAVLQMGVSEEIQAWVRERMALGDPGPCSMRDGFFWTEKWLQEQGEHEEVVGGLEVRAATDEEQKEALDARLKATGGVPGTERMSGPRPAGSWGYVVRREGVAVEVVVAWEHRGYQKARLEVKVGTVHELVAWDGGTSGDVEESCDLVGGACRSHGLFFMLYEPLNQLLLFVKQGYLASEEVWQLLEHTLEARIRERKGALGDG